jgi:tetratricopeptide (TPR) repeat protein
MRIDWIEKYMADAERMIVEGGQQLEQGMMVLNDLLYEEPGYGSLHNHLGWAHLYYTLDFAKAEVHLTAAIRFHPEFQAPYLHLGTLYMRQGRYDHALDMLNEGLKRPQANRSGMLELIGQAHEMRGEFKLAIKAYREAMLSTLVSGEMNVYAEGVKRCRRKRWSSMFK